ncbi:MAG: sulfotransferase domain-containing protein [Pirellulaceae bacterium]
MQYIFCCGMYRSSSTWQYEVVSHLVEEYRQGVRLGFVQGKRLKELPGREHGLQAIRILKTHDVQEIFKRELNAGNAIPIYSYRDLRDVAFSYMHKAALTFEELIKQKFLEKVLANDAFWRAAPHVVCQKYEDVIADEVAAVIRLSRAVGVELSRDQAVQIAQEYSWEANLKRSHEVADRAKATGIDLTKKANVFTQDEHTLLHWNHLRQGARKSWRELATPSQREVLFRKCGSWLVANGYEADDSWAASEYQARTSAVARLDGRSLGARPTAWFRSLWQGIASRLSLRH